MQINIQELLSEIIEYTQVTIPAIHKRTQNILTQLKDEFTILATNPNLEGKQEKMITLFMGGVIMALYEEECYRNYPHLDQSPFKLYPGDAYNLTKTQLQEKNLYKKLTDVELMYAVGKNVLLNLPNDFSGNLFKIKNRSWNSPEPKSFFPNLEKNSIKIDYLVKFCLENKKNLNVPTFELDNLSQSGVDTHLQEN